MFINHGLPFSAGHEMFEMCASQRKNWVACSLEGKFGNAEPLNMKHATSRATRLLTVEPSAIARCLLWHLFSLDTACLRQADVHEPFEKPGVHLFWVLSGQGTLEIGAESYDLMPGNCVWFADMAQRRVYRPRAGQPLVKQGFRFGGPAVESWHKQLGGAKKARFFLEEPEFIRSEFQEMWQISRRKPKQWDWQIHLIITKILGQLLNSRKLLSPNEPEIPAPVVRVLNILASNPFYDWKVKDMAVSSGVSYSKLRDLFSKALGQSLHEFIQHRRLDQARMLVADEKLSIKQIADQLHFSTEFYFSHFFKKLTGMSPTAFRILQSKKK